MSDSNPRGTIQLPSDFLFGELRPNHLLSPRTCTVAVTVYREEDRPAPQLSVDETE
jgi:hypothetical protein